MEYRTLGGTGLVVSVLGFGLMTVKDVNHAKAMIRKCREAGVNFFDNAEAYGNPRGSAELRFGEALRQLQQENPELWRRSDLVITTKLFWSGKMQGGGVNEIGLSRKHIKEGMDKSLERLQLDYVDVVYAHRPDPLTPTEEVVRAFTQLIRSGKAFYWGTSEWSAQQITEAFWIAKTYGLIAPIVEQPQYNLLHRDRFEVEYARLYEAPYRIGTTVWGSLASGFLTGKYRFGKIPENSRRADPLFARFKVMYEARARAYAAGVEKFIQYAEEKNVSPAMLAYAWTAKNPNVSVVIIGASRPEQLDETLTCLDIARDLLTDEEMKVIEKRIGTKPPPQMHFGRVITSKL